jgi:hypothetical protein
MERFDQGHLHPKLEVPGQTKYVPAGNRTQAFTWEEGTLKKSHSNSLLIAIQNIYI